MLRLKEIQLLSQETIVNSFEFEDQNYIFGSNNKGKTLLAKIIDLMLGESENFLQSNPEGLELITSIVAKITTFNGDIFLKRTILNECYLKYSRKEVFSLVDLDTYKRTIMQSLVSLNNEELALFNDIYEENISYRSFSFLNFIDEIGIGNISTVFTRVKEPKHAYRFKNILEYIFNYEIIKKKKQKMKEVEEKSALYEKEKNNNRIYLETLKKIESIFKKYNLKYTDDLKKDFANFTSFKNSNAIEKDNNKNYDLFKLLEISNNLYEQIKIEEALQKQSTLTITRNEKTEKVVSIFNDILCQGSEYKKYQDLINKSLKKSQNNNEILLVKDYSKTIQNYYQAKDEVDEKIELIRRNLSLISFEDKIKDIIYLDESFKSIETVSVTLLRKLEIEIKLLRDEIKNLDNKLRNSKQNILNNKITKLYTETRNDIDFINADKNKNKFSINFDERRLSVFGSYFKKDEVQNYLPGSLARMTTWQICTYIGLIEYILENKRNLPLIPLLCIDGLEQPFDNNNEKNNYKNVLELALNLSINKTIQLFIISKENDDNIIKMLEGQKVNIINLGKGLNPLHTKANNNK